MGWGGGQPHPHLISPKLGLPICSIAIPWAVLVHPTELYQGVEDGSFEIWRGVSPLIPPSYRVPISHINCSVASHDGTSYTAEEGLGPGG